MMKKLIKTVTVIVCSCFLMPSCSDNKSQTDDIPRDTSLAGSISFENYRFEAEGSYDGTKLDNFDKIHSYLSITKESDTKVSFSCSPVWGETTFKVVIPSITVLGEPHNATFDDASDNANVWHNETEYTAVNAQVKGWIKETGMRLSPAKGEKDPVTPEYTCEILIDCTLDGKPLKLKITSVTSRSVAP